MSIELYKEMMELIGPIISTAGVISFTISLIIMLINILINAATGRGLKF